MKDKKCKTKGCKEMICSKMSKSGLCTRCNAKDWKRKNQDRLTVKYRKQRHEHYLENRDYVLNHMKKRYERKRELLIAESKARYDADPKKWIERTREYTMKKYHNDEGFRIRIRLGTVLNGVIRKYIKTGKIGNPLPQYDIDWAGIILVLSPIPKDREKYHVDHIKPFCDFDLRDYSQVREVMKPENHRWVLAEENLKKGGRKA